jgi:hypothetical protein
VDGGVGWVLHGAEGIGPALWVFALIAGLGYGFFPVDLADRNRAERVAAQGEWATSNEVQVHVDWVDGRSGGYFEVDHVRVRVPGTLGQVTLDNVDGLIDDDTGLHEGWQAPTAQTGYQAPLRVKYVADERAQVQTAIAARDLDYWTDNNTDPEFGLVFGSAGVVLALMALALNNVRLTRKERRPPQSPKGAEADLVRRREERIAATGRRGYGGASQPRIQPWGGFEEPVTAPDGNRYTLVPARTGTIGWTYDGTAPVAALVLPVLWCVNQVGSAIHGFGWTVWLRDDTGGQVARRRYRTHDAAMADLPRLAAAVRAQGREGLR